jgi:ABC-2 type transport system ATP-binding protein
MANNTPAIQTKNLTQKYGSFVAIKDVNLTVQEGEVFGFLGPNGAGKTTTIRTLLDYIRPAAGSAQIFGKDVRRHSVEIHRDIAYLPSELTLWDNTTGTHYIRWLSKVYGKDLIPEARQLADRFQFDLDRKLSGMSTGMKRKMGLIAALAHRPKLLILDEPTIGLDPLMQDVFQELMLEAKAEGRTVFMSSHTLPEVERLCDRVGIIREGKLQAVETVEKLTRVTFRWVTVTYNEQITPDGLSAMEGVNDLSVEGATLRMRVEGDADLDAVLRQVLEHKVADMDIEHPTLEEIFLSYYGKQNNHAKGHR